MLRRQAAAGIGASRQSSPNDARCSRICLKFQHWTTCVLQAVAKWLPSGEKASQVKGCGFGEISVARGWPFEGSTNRTEYLDSAMAIVEPSLVNAIQ